MTTTFKSFAEQGQHYFNRPHQGVPESVIQAPAAWTGETIHKLSDRWTYELTPEDIAELRRAVDNARSNGIEMTELDANNFVLPQLGPKISSWAHEVHYGLGLMLVRGLPVSEWTAEDVALVYWGIGHHMGSPGAQNADEELLGHVTDYGENDPNVRLYRTSANINFHCDAADIVGLLCLHPAMHGGQSRIISTVTLFNELFAAEPGLVPRLFEPFRLDRRDRLPQGTRPYGWIQPAAWDGSTLRTFYHSDYFRSVERHADVSLTVEEKGVLDFYDDRGSEERLYLDMWLEAGDMQFISNHTIAHARTAYEDHADPAMKRHLLRLWLSVE